MTLTTTTTTTIITIITEDIDTGGNLPSLSINYVGMSKDIEKCEICGHGPNYMQKL